MKKKINFRKFPSLTFPTVAISSGTKMVVPSLRAIFFGGSCWAESTEAAAVAFGRVERRAVLPLAESTEGFLPFLVFTSFGRIGCLAIGTVLKNKLEINKKNF